MLLSLCLGLALSAADPLTTSLARVPERRAEWQALLAKLPKTERATATYLLAYMPLGDLRALPTVKLAEAVHFAEIARRGTKWGPKVPDAIFLDAVAPYASVTEPRQSLRAEFQQKYLPLVRETKTSGEAALAINKVLFKDYKVTYNTRRLRTDQSAPETIAQGMATCTGLSIMLVDALRAVGVPARVAGIPSWPGRGGNHTWVEVWDAGRWHFVGAAEPDDNGLDHGWFAEEAGRVPGTNPMETIYAVTYKPTGIEFPLVWDPGGAIQAENVTARYAIKQAPVAPRLMVEVRANGERVIADVIAFNARTGDRCLNGQSLGPQADVNLHLSAPAAENDEVKVTATYQGRTITETAVIKGDTVVRLNLDDAQAKIPVNASTLASAWRAFLASPDPDLRAEFDAKTVRTSDRSAPYQWRTVGTKPKTGWGLVIAMHGGGGAPPEVNDSEWNRMFQTYYQDQPDAPGYVYLALRAPNNDWDGFYDSAISPLIERLIRQFVKYAEVDPNAVYACGASHGGYGTFVIGPKIPHRFAALHPAAGAPTPDRTAGENLRNVRFTWAVGENDTDYNRITLNRAFQDQWTKWKAQYGGFDGGLEEIKGHGHLINDTEKGKVAEFRRYRRNPYPTHVIWTQTDDRVKRFYWLEALAPTDKGRIEATVSGNEITVTSRGQGKIALWLSAGLVDLTKPVVVIRDGVRQTFTVTPSLTTYANGLLQTGDPELSAPVRIEI
jgi:poly(3-hydroxybutyrate) depolymerase